jgi:signal peptidase I
VATSRDATVAFLKRIVAGPGDRVAIRAGRVIRNGKPTRESFVTPCHGRAAGCDLPRSLTVAAGRYYVLGDDRGASDDSRFWGPVRAKAIVGRVTRLGP